MAFSYLDDFNRVLQEGYVSDRPNGKSQSYIIEVGEPVPRTFLNLGGCYRMIFSTKQDADNALYLVRHTLKLVDENLLRGGLKLSDVRNEILNAVAKKFYDTGEPIDPEANVLADVEDAIKGVCDYYIGVDDCVAPE